ncbi:ornithine cyclodeaminase [Pseudomonas sp. LLC-1]|uniref:ornithine cyclodeaminase n=1 Tax=Pseudomonas sp. LLC-1 TaxID=1812180 RepID=UPI000D017243|nr:ornithine cyclodeaminase [Pseudomonas sp. LLC-1]PRN03054.1 ornithine cyclodeaminase [Pseudomonas sp. LLC-1]
MTRFISVSDLSNHLAEEGVEPLLRRLTDYIEADFRRWPEFDKSARLASHSDVGVIELMPVSDAGRYAFKYVNGHPDNIAHNLSTVMAFGVLADVATGYPLLLSELTLTTAIRTAATSALAARYLARDDAKVMALIGNGCQSEFQAIAFHTLLGIERIQCFDVDPLATQKLLRNLKDFPGLEVVACSSAREAAQGVDVITTVTADKCLATILTADMLAPGVHVNAVGGDCPGKTELDKEVLLQASVFVEYEPQTRIEGDIQQLPADFPVTELWTLIAEGRHGRTCKDEITVFDSVGFALEDYSALRLLHELAVQDGLGGRIELVPQLADPKDLYALTKDGRSTRSLRKVA